MVRVIVDNSLRTQLDAYDAPVQLCDESGRLIGHFVPVQVPSKQEPAVDQCPYTKEELSRMQQETGGRALSEIWNSL